VEQLKERMRPDDSGWICDSAAAEVAVAADPDAERCMGCSLHHLVGDHGHWRLWWRRCLAHLQGQEGELAEAVAYRGHVAQALWHAVGRMPGVFPASWRRSASRRARFWVDGRTRDAVRSRGSRGAVGELSQRVRSRRASEE